MSTLILLAGLLFTQAPGAPNEPSEPSVEIPEIVRRVEHPAELFAVVVFSDRLTAYSLPIDSVKRVADANKLVLGSTANPYVFLASYTVPKPATRPLHREVSNLLTSFGLDEKAASSKEAYHEAYDVLYGRLLELEGSRFREDARTRVDTFVQYASKIQDVELVRQVASTEATELFTGRNQLYFRGKKAVSADGPLAFALLAIGLGGLLCWWLYAKRDVTDRGRAYQGEVRPFTDIAASRGGMAPQSVPYSSVPPTTPATLDSTRTPRQD